MTSTREELFPYSKRCGLRGPSEAHAPALPRAAEGPADDGAVSAE